MSFAMTKTEKLRRSVRVRECLAQYQRMQREDMRELFPDWFEKEGDALDAALVTLTGLLNEHQRDRDRRAARAAAKAAREV